jgi:DNA modification methylase
LKYSIFDSNLTKMKNLTLQEREFLIEQLAKGSNIPDDFKEKLFPTTQKEYELRYAGKMRKEDLLADQDGTFAVPLQVEKIYNGERKKFADGWSNMLVFGDNLQFLKTIYKNEDPLIKDKVKGKIKLIYIDPPFATESDFNSSLGQKAYSDKTKDSEFVEFIRRRLILAKEILANDAAIFVHLDNKKVHYIKLILDEIFGENNFRNEIIWKRKGGSANPMNRLGVVTDTILFYSNSSTIKLNQLYTKDTPEAGKYLKERFNNVDENGRNYLKSPIVSPNYRENLCYEYKGYKAPKNGWSISKDVMEQWDLLNKLYFPQKKDGKIYRKIYLDEYQGQPVQNLWTDLHVINPMSNERLDYPTQKPEALAQRIIELVTNENDLVFDFFGGSATLASVAEKMNRKWITCDIGKYSYYTSQKRMLTIQESKSIENPKKTYDKKSKSFVTVNTGIYDLEKMQGLDKGKYIEFVLQLFEVTPKKTIKKGFAFHGEKKDGYPVIVWDYLNNKNSNLDIFFLENLHQTLGKSIDKRVYIIAPANAVDFISDFYEIDDVRYYFLKIPYQIIKELHPKDFAKIRQPQSKNKVNDLDNAIGFHFSLQPDVEAFFINDSITITKFSSNFREEETNKTLQNFESLSMVVIDNLFNGEDFMMSHCFFKDDIQDKENNLQITLEEYGEEICVIFIDIYGNEFKQILKTK